MRRWSWIVIALCLISWSVRAEVRTAEERVRRGVQVTLTSEGEIAGIDLIALRAWVKGCGRSPIIYLMNLAKSDIEKAGERLNQILSTIISEQGGVVDDSVRLLSGDHQWPLYQVEPDEEPMIELSCGVSLRFELESNGKNHRPEETHAIPRLMPVASDSAVLIEEQHARYTGPSCLGLPVRCALTVSTGGGLVSHADADSIRLSVGAGLDLDGAWWLLGAHLEVGIASETAQGQWYSGRLHAMWRPLAILELGPYAEYGRGNESFAFESDREWVGWGARALVYLLILRGGNRRVGFELLAPLGMRQFSAGRELVIDGQRYQQTASSLQRWGFQGGFFFRL